MDLTLDKKLQGFQLVAQEKLQAILCSIPGKKELILEPALIKPLEHVCTASWLKLKGIQRIYKHDAAQSLPRSPDQVHIYMIRSVLGTFQTLLRQLQPVALEEMPDISLKMYHIVCVPSCYSYFQTLLEQAGLWGLVQLHHFNWDFIYFDQGVLSLELPNLYECIYLQGNSSPLPAVAQSLRLLQMICGQPSVILSFGSHSSQLLQMLQALGKVPEPTNPPDYGGWLIIDRDKDYPASLLTPAIYAGLLLEVFQQRSGEILVDNSQNKISSQRVELLQGKSSKGGLAHASSKPCSIRLNSASDEIYGDNRYKHFAQVSSLIRAQVKALGLELQKLNDMQLEEMHDYVARKLPKLTELKAKVLRHLNASEIVIKMMGNFRRLQTLEEDILNNVSRKRLLGEIDELLTTDGQRFNTLRLLCLLHHCAGVAPEELQSFAMNYCNLFGHQELSVFQQLTQAGLLPQLLPEKKAPTTKLLSNLPLPKFQQTEFQANANRLKLLTSFGDGQDGGGMSASAKNQAGGLQSCPSFVFNGTYIPLVAQLCSILLKTNSAEELASKLAMIEGLHLHLECGRTTLKAYANQMKTSGSADQDVFPLRQRNLFVFVVGGASYAEIAACDFVAKLTGAQITVASDSLMAGSDLISAAFNH